jgi:MerR family copper efflux transcriptional regulator
MNIGEAARSSGVPAKTIRYYESIGLIAPAQRSQAGYRSFDGNAIETLRFIQRARSLGFPVRDVGRLLDLWRDRARSSAEVKAMAVAHIASIDQKIVELRSMRESLWDLNERCQGDDRPECPILDGLAGAAATENTTAV